MTYIAHLASDRDPRLTLCGEPWQGWQEPLDADLAGSGPPRSPHSVPVDATINQCQACLRVAKEHPMSKYPVKYVSSSGEAHNIEDLHGGHLINAWRKLLTTRSNDPALPYMRQELVARGFTFNTETERWVAPESGVTP